MGILLAFAPFIVFGVVNLLAGGTAGLIGGAAVSASMVVRDLLTAGRSPKVLEIGSMVLFAGLALYAVLLHPAWSVFGVRLRVDSGLLLIVLLSIAIRRPFTLQYALERVAPEHWGNASFIRANYVITGVWALAFGVLVATDFAVAYVPSLPPSVGVIATVVALVAAMKFPGWYRERIRTRAAG